MFCALHHGFIARFKKVVDEWGAGLGLTPTLHPIELGDAQCQHPPPLPPSPSRAETIGQPPLAGFAAANMNEQFIFSQGQRQAWSYYAPSNRRQSMPQNQLGTGPFSGRTSPPAGISELEGTTMPPHLPHPPELAATCIYCMQGQQPPPMPRKGLFRR